MTNLKTQNTYQFYGEVLDEYFRTSTTSIDRFVQHFGLPVPDATSGTDLYASSVRYSARNTSNSPSHERILKLTWSQGMHLQSLRYKVSRSDYTRDLRCPHRWWRKPHQKLTSEGPMLGRSARILLRFGLHSSSLFIYTHTHFPF
jgi:hypothetical protein